MKKITTLLVVLLTFGFAFAQPTTNAPVPTKAAADVLAIYNSSNTYTNNFSNLNPNWGQSGFATNNTAFTNGGTISPVINYVNFNYQGLDIVADGNPPGVNVVAMEYIHLDIWSSSLTSIRLVPIQNSGPEEGFVIAITSPGTWVSVDIPVTAFANTNFGGIRQLKFDTAAPANGLSFFVDNIYFWKTPIAAGSDANLSDLKVDGTTISGFSANTITYTKGYPSGTTMVPQITLATTNDVNATQVINQATTIPGTATVVVTSQNTSVTKTYTVNYVIEGPATAAPTPPARAAANVISLFSDAYTNIAVTEWSASWDDSNITDVTIVGNATKKIDFGNFTGTILTDYNDATAMTHFHMDYWIPATTDLAGKVLNPKWSNHAAMSGETNALLLTNLPTVNGSWVSLDVPLSTFTPGGMTPSLNREKLKEFLLSSNLGTVYVDNIYLHNNIVLSNETFTTSKVNMYPNPTNNIVNINSIENIDSVTVMNVLGQTVMTKVVNSNDFTLDISELTSGQYFLNLTSNNTKVVKKLIKN